MVNEDEQTTEILDSDVFEVSLVPSGSQQIGDQGFTIVKADGDNTKQSNEEGDDSVTDKEKSVKVEDLSSEDKKELLTKLKDEFDVDEKVELLLDGDEITERVKEKLEVDEDEVEETEKSITPKSREALKTVLDKLSKVKHEIPENYIWVYKAIANLVDETAPDFEKSAEPAVEVSESVKEAIDNSLEAFDKEELSDEEIVIKNALEGISVEEKEEEEETELSKEAQEKLEKYEQELNKVKKEKMELEKEQLKKQLMEKADTLNNIPENKEKLTELYAELYNKDEDLFKKVDKLLRKVDKQTEIGELFAEKGTQGREVKKNETAEQKLDRLVEEKLEKDEAKDQAEAMTKVLEENKELYTEIKG